MDTHFEKYESALEAFFSEHARPEMSDRELEDLMDKFMDAYSSKAPGRVTPENAEAAEDFIELAESSTRIPEILKYARKAQQKDPGNIDAMRMIALFSTNNP